MVQISFITYPSKINGGAHKITQNANHRAPPSWMPETSTDVVKYCKNDFKRLKKKKFPPPPQNDLQHQKLKLYLHLTKKSLEVIRINFVEIPWLVSLLKTRVFTFPDVVSTASRDDLNCNSPETGRHLHLTEKGLTVVMNFLGTCFDTTFWSKLINSAHSKTFLIFPSASFPMQPMISAKYTSCTPAQAPGQ